MIQIKHKDLAHLCNLHFEAIKNYFDNPRTKIVQTADYQAIDNWIKSYLGKDINFEKIIKAIPSELEDLKEKLDKLNKKLPKKNVKKIKDLYNTFAASSGNLTAQKEKYNGFILLEKLKITVCPYCNRNFIYNTEKHRTSELDHFFNKDTYPILALSFYNLVPSCKVCNKIKLANNQLVINPYDNRVNFDAFVKFRLKIKEADFYYKTKDFKILWNKENTPSNFKARVDNHIKLFQLESLYNHHKDWVLDIIQKNIIYNESYIDSLFQQFEGVLFKNREDVIRLLSSNYINEEDLDKRPLAKLTRDISEDLGLL
jgi:hypothetical protein